jgi:hypothetical protein
VLTTCQPSTVWCSRKRLPAAAAQPAKFRQSCSATDYIICTTSFFRNSFFTILYSTGKYQKFPITVIIYRIASRGYRSTRFLTSKHNPAITSVISRNLPFHFLPGTSNIRTKWLQQTASRGHNQRVPIFQFIDEGELQFSDKAMKTGAIQYVTPGEKVDGVVLLQVVRQELF